MVYGQILHRRGPDESFLNLNVGGFKQKVSRVVLQRFPHTRLGQLLLCSSESAILELCDDYGVAEREFYFDRNPRFFRYVLNFYHTGKIHLMEELCVFSFSQELEYWGITELYLDSCCINKFQEQKDGEKEHDWDRHDDEQLHESFDSSFEELSELEKDLEKFEDTWCASIRKQLWLRLENPAHSLSAKLLAVLSLSVVLISIAAMCVHSMPEFHHVNSNEQATEDPVLAAFETFCVLWFTFEFVVRLAVAPSIRKFIGNALNVIDFVSIVPFYATLALEKADAEESEELENVGKVVQILRLMRVFRILKLARHSVGLRSLGATLRHSYHEVGLLILFLSVGISIFSVLVYFAEKDDDESELQTIPVGWWWATISMTTVGYGDTYPITLAGKLIGTLCIVCGLLVVALPITIIFNKFSKYYERQKALVESDQFGGNLKVPIPGIPIFNVNELYANGDINSILDSLSTTSIAESEGDDKEIQDIKTVCPSGLTVTPSHDVSS